MIIKQTTTTTILSKPVILVVISFLILALIYSSFSESYVFAAAVKRGPIQCTPVHNAVKCCQTETDKKGIEIRWCTICDDTNPPSNCEPRYQALVKNPGNNAPTNTNIARSGPDQVLGQSQTILNLPTSNVGRSSIDCTKNPGDPLCKPAGINPPSDSANLAPDNNNNNNNNPTIEDHKPKGSDLGQLIGGGDSAAKKGNNDNSPTPPACPDKGPIPPNCTLKPKF